MKVKFKDLVSFMEYATKEKPEYVSVNIDNFKFDLSFMDSENRNCTVTIFESMVNTTPELTKNMKLYTRLKETAKKESEDE
jgi:hypothetical protein